MSFDTLLNQKRIEVLNMNNTFIKNADSFGLIKRFV